MQWPNNTNPTTQLVNSLFIDFSNLGMYFNPSAYTACYGCIGAHGMLPAYRFSVLTPQGLISHGWYDSATTKWLFDPPIDQDAIMATRVSAYYIRGADTMAYSTWN